MRLVFPEPVGARAHEVETVEAEGMVLRVVAIEPLPDDRAAWRRRIVGADVAHDDMHTPTGWPVAIVAHERSVWGFYELFDRGVAVAVTAAAGGQLDVARARQLLEAADLDRTPREIVALAQLWETGE